MNKKYPKISIVTPSYNQGKYIEQTIDSVLSQNYPNLDYIIIDGGSTDDSAEIIRRYEKHLSFWVSEKDKGQSDAIQKGLARATGDVFNWLNSDDYLSENALFEVAEAFQNPDILLFAGLTAYTDGVRTTDISRTRIFVKPAKTIAYAAVSQPAMFYDMKTFRALGGVNSALHYCMDKELFLKFLLIFGQDKIFSSEKVIAYFRIHEEAKSWDMTPFLTDTANIYADLARKSGLNDAAKTIEKYLASAQKKGYALDLSDKNLDQKFVEEILQNFLFSMGEHFYYSGNFPRAFRLFSSLDTQKLDSHDEKLTKSYLKDCVKNYLLSPFRKK
jgi:glycosyltransferase involved in cell wall biosynthesis